MVAERLRVVVSGRRAAGRQVGWAQRERARARERERERERESVGGPTVVDVRSGVVEERTLPARDVGCIPCLCAANRGDAGKVSPSPDSRGAAVPAA